MLTDTTKDCNPHIIYSKSPIHLCERRLIVIHSVLEGRASFDFRKNCMNHWKDKDQDRPLTRDSVKSNVFAGGLIA